MTSHIILVAFEVEREGSREDAERVLHAALGETLGEHHAIVGTDKRFITGSIDSWWVAEDDRLDGSDCDSAVFVRPGEQHRASKRLFDQDLTDAHNVIPKGRSEKWGTR
jgi:hypothetical protein